MAVARKTFKLSHSLVGGVGLVLVEAVLLSVLSALGDWLIFAVAILGSSAVLYIATEVIEEVRSARHVLALLSVVVGEFVAFFAAQYYFLLQYDPASYPTVPHDAISLLLHSTMVFVFNPLYLPATADGRVLLFINTLAALGLVFFVLQNIWQFRRN